MRQFFLCLLCVWLSLFSAASIAASSPPLPTEKAFQFSVSIPQANEVDLHWKIAPNYYLYQKKFHFTFSPDVKYVAQFPKGEWKANEKRGHNEVFSGDLRIPLLLQTNAQSVRLSVDYQGCSKDGFCYPPVHKEMTLHLAGQTVSHHELTFNYQSLMTDQNNIKSFLHATSMSGILLLFMGLGLLLAFTPCILPVIPILTGVIVGQSQPVSTKKALLLTCAYILGMSLAYAFAGLIAAMMGHSLQVWLQNRWVISITSALFVLLALSLFGAYYLRLPRRMHNAIARWSHRQQSGTYAGAFCMGSLSTLIVSPCVTAPLVGVLLYIAETGNQVLGASALFAMGMGMGLPLLLVGVSAGKWLPKSGPWMEAIKKGFGFIMLGMAIWLLSRIMPATMITIMWGLLLFGLAFFLAAYLPLLIKHHVVIRGLGCVAGLLGLFFILSATPLWHHTASNSLQNTVVVNSVTEVNKHIAAANALHLPVILDFYANWCESCVSMERNVFSQPSVKKALANFVVLRADLSANNASDQVLLKHFNVVAPPTFLFFNSDGKEVNTRRIVGELSASEFLSKLTLFHAEGCDKQAQC